MHPGLRGLLHLCWTCFRSVITFLCVLHLPSSMAGTPRKRLSLPWKAAPYFQPASAQANGKRVGTGIPDAVSESILPFKNKKQKQKKLVCPVCETCLLSLVKLASPTHPKCHPKEVGDKIILEKLPDGAYFTSLFFPGERGASGGREIPLARWSCRCGGQRTQMYLPAYLS